MVVGAVPGGAADACEVVVVAAGPETSLAAAAAEEDSAGGVSGWVAGAEPWVWLGEAIFGGSV